MRTVWMKMRRAPVAERSLCSGDAFGVRADIEELLAQSS
jgi:hypothetical protein